MDHPIPQSRMGQRVTVDLILVDQPAPGFMKQFNVTLPTHPAGVPCARSHGEQSTGEKNSTNSSMPGTELRRVYRPGDPNSPPTNPFHTAHHSTGHRQS